MEGEICGLFFYLLFFPNTTRPLCLGAGWGAATELAPRCRKQKQHLLARGGNAISWRELKMAILGFVLKYLQ